MTAFLDRPGGSGKEGNPGAASKLRSTLKNGIYYVSSFMSEKKIFTYQEAKQLIPYVWKVTHDAFQQINGITEELRAPSADDHRTELEERYEMIVSSWAEQMKKLGCEIKGLWLVDFDNGKGYYCWKYPEKALDHYHTYEDGFTGRMRIN